MCGGCNSSLRARDEAHVLVDEFGDGRRLTLDAVVAEPAFQGMSVYNIGCKGPIRSRLSKLDAYVDSRLDPDMELGATHRDGVSNQDLQQLTFPDDSFDLVVSSHIMEHVPEPRRGFAEIARVLKPGGRMVHSIPARFPLPEKTKARAELRDGEIVHHAEARYHESPEGEPALVFTDFGADLGGMLDELGFDARLRRPHLQIQQAVRNLLLVGRLRRPA